MKKVSLILSAVVMTAMMLMMTAMMLSFNRSGASTEEGATTEEVTIGEQVWMTKNLNVDKFRNGDPILEAKTEKEWREAGNNKVPAWCYYDDNPDNGERYGKLYNWHAVSDPRGLAPKGWKIPFDEDWSRLTDYLGGKEAEKKMKSTSGWIYGDNGTNESSFSGLPGGYRSFDGTFNLIGEDGGWWSSTEATTDGARFRGLGLYGGDIGKDYSLRGSGFSVRCLRD